MCGRRRRARRCRSIHQAVGDRRSLMRCWNATGGIGRIRLKTVSDFGLKVQGAWVILAGDVGGTKCNLALFSEKDGKLTPIFRQRFASKEFAQFDRIVKEFSRQAAPYLA